jgi:NDP-sugar pyrophosphorylase family protein
VQTIVIPMAGRGSRFADAGYAEPKPLIGVRGVPMIRLVIENLRPEADHRFVFVCQGEHVTEYRLDSLLPQWAPGCAIVSIDGVTDGAACTVLEAREYIDMDDVLVIANSDQYVDAVPSTWLRAVEEDQRDGVILTMWADDPKWSYVEKDHGRVTRVVEKEVVSDEATVGIYVFRRGADFVNGADRMIAAGDMVNGEFYVAPVYNYLIRDGWDVTTASVGTVGAGMYGLGTPADLEDFLGREVSVRATQGLAC